MLTTVTTEPVAVHAYELLRGLEHIHASARPTDLDDLAQRIYDEGYEVAEMFHEVIVLRIIMRLSFDRDLTPAERSHLEILRCSRVRWIATKAAERLAEEDQEAVVDAIPSAGPET